jgi:hypothetical protein
VKTTVNVHLDGSGDVSAVASDDRSFVTVRFGKTLIPRVDVFLHDVAQADALIRAAVAAKDLLLAAQEPPDPALMNDILDPGLCNLPGPDGPCQGAAGHPHYVGVVAPGRCLSCAATVDHEGKVTPAGAR